MSAEDLRVLLLSLVPTKRAELSSRYFFDDEELTTHRAGVEAWNKCRDEFIDKANKVFQDALREEEMKTYQKKQAQYKDGRDYFERGCLCIINGEIEESTVMDNEAAVRYYMSECKCSRHPDYPQNTLPNYKIK